MTYSRLAVNPCSWDQIFDLNDIETPSDMAEIQDELGTNGHKWQEWKGSTYFSYFEIERNREDAFTIYLRGANKIHYPILEEAPTEVVLDFVRHARKAPIGTGSLVANK